MKTLLQVFALSSSFAAASVAHAMGAASPVDPGRDSRYSHLDPKYLVPREALNTALEFFDANKARISNQNYITIVDFSQHSGRRRFFVVNMQSGEVEDLHTAHGSGSDTDHNGYADTFSNIEGSKKSSIGFYLTGSTYQGKHGLSLYLDGLSSTNSKARARAIVVHGADYVDPSFSKMGRSWGCPALTPSVTARIVGQLKGKSLIYAFN